MAPRLVGSHQDRATVVSTAPDRYDLHETLQAAGPGVVYRASDRLLGREVALRTLTPDQGADAALVVRFRSAVGAWAAVKHPRVAQVYDYGVAERGTSGVPYVVTELAPGGTLQEALQRWHRLPEADALALAAQVAEALDAAHRAGVVHGGLEPLSVLLDEQGAPKVTDFGVAVAVGSPPAGEGSPPSPRAVSYRSPEQLQRTPTDARTDLYSVGVLLFELLTGRLPSGDESLMALAIPPPQTLGGRRREVLPLLLPSTGAVLLKALTRTPAERYQSAAEMREALAQARLRAIEAGARPASPAETTAMMLGKVSDYNEPTSTSGPPPARSSSPGASDGVSNLALPPDPPAAPTLPTLPTPPRPFPGGRGNPASITRLLSGDPGGRTDPTGSAGGADAAPPHVVRTERRRRRARAGTRLTFLLIPAALVLLAFLAAAVRPAGDPAAARPAGVADTAPAADAASDSAALPPAPELASPTVMTSPRGATPVAPLSDPGVTGVAGVTGVVEAAPATPAPAAPTAMASARSSESERAAPAQAVLAFYALAAAGQFDGAARLWSPQMLVAYPPGEHVTQRFSQTRELTVRRAEVVSLDETTGRASVAVDLVEVLGTPPVTRRYVGTWQLVRGPGGWLLDQPNLRAE